MSFALLAFSRRGQMDIIRGNELLTRPWPLPSYLGREMSNGEGGAGGREKNKQKRNNNETHIIGEQSPFIPFKNCYRCETM